VGGGFLLLTAGTVFLTNEADIFAVLGPLLPRTPHPLSMDMAGAP
jgi:hypothetical protein